MPEILIPFPGLYESWLSQMLDSEEEQFGEYRAEEESEPGDSFLPEPLRLDASAHCDAVFWAMSYSVAHEALARAYLESFDEWAGEALEETRPAWRKVYRRDPESGEYRTLSERYRADSCGMTWAAMESPREYNFTTDRLFANVSAAFVRRLFNRSKAEGHETLRRVIRDSFTSYDGFRSFYSNRLEDWTDKPLSEWDHNETGTLLRAVLELTGAEDDGGSLMYSVMEGETAYRAFDSGMEWETYDARILEKRAERFLDWYEDEPEAAARWLAGAGDLAEALAREDSDIVAILENPPEGGPVTLRCDKTPDLFTGETGADA